LQDNLAKIHHNVGVLQEAAGQLDAALASFSRARPIWERLAREHPKTPDFASKTGDVLGKIARLHRKKVQFDAARESAEQAIEWQKQALALDPNNPTYKKFLTAAQETLKELSQISNSNP